MEASCFRHASGLIFNTSDSLDAYKRAYKGKDFGKWRVIRNGYDPECLAKVQAYSGRNESTAPYSRYAIRVRFTVTDH